MRDEAPEQRMLRPGKVGWAFVSKLLLACLVAGWVVLCAAAICPLQNAGLLLFAATATLVLGLATLAASLARQLPFQNVLLACVVLVLAGGGLYALNFAVEFPFGARIPGAKLGVHLAWVWPMTWVTTLLAARGVARLVLYPHRSSVVYGYWSLGTSVLLAVAFEFALEPIAMRILGAWSWAPDRIPLDWYGTPFRNFLGFAISALLTLAFLTPVLLSKSPVPRRPNYYPLCVWLLFELFFAVAGAKHHLWGVVAISGGSAAIVAALVWHARTTGRQPD